MQEKERQRKDALDLAANASAEANMTAEQLRGVTEQLREALAESETAKRQVSKLLVDTENAEHSLKKALAEAQAARQEAERMRDIERKRREQLEEKYGKMGDMLKK